MTRRIAFVTGTRAEYGLLRYVMRGIAADESLTLQLVATGMHLSPEFGLTVTEIEADGFAIDARVEMLVSSDTAVGTAKSMGLGLIGFADAFDRLRPDLVVVLGDRFEIFAAAAAALVARLPIAHLHGGETTEGAFDEALRHSITKMAHLHFVAAEPYRRRVVQLGEDPQRVFLVGGLGVDAITRVAPMDRAALSASLDIALGERPLVVTFHPSTLDASDPAAQMAALLDALADCPAQLIFTLPNADAGGRALSAMVAAFVAVRPNAHAFASLGQQRYFSLLRLAGGVVGNSSSGLAEAPSFGIGTVNIGARQDGRLKAASVIDCAADATVIRAAVATLQSDAHRHLAAATANPYGSGGAAAQIVDTLRTVPLAGLIRKRFHDLPGDGE